MDEERELYAGTLEADRFEAWLGKNVKKAGEWYKDASADQAGIGDDMLRLLGGGAKNIAWASELPGIKQGFQALDALSYYGGKVGGAAARAVNVDPRIGGAIGNVLGEVATGFGAKAAVKYGGKAAKITAKAGLRRTAQPVFAKTDAIDDVNRVLNKADDINDPNKYYQRGQDWMEQEFDYIPRNSLRRQLQTPEEAAYLKDKFIGMGMDDAIEHWGPVTKIPAAEQGITSAVKGADRGALSRIVRYGEAGRESELSARLRKQIISSQKGNSGLKYLEKYAGGDIMKADSHHILDIDFWGRALDTPSGEIVGKVLWQNKVHTGNAGNNIVWAWASKRGHFDHDSLHRLYDAIPERQLIEKRMAQGVWQKMKPDIQAKMLRDVAYQQHRLTNNFFAMKLSFIKKQYPEIMEGVKHPRHLKNRILQDPDKYGQVPLIMDGQIFNPKNKVQVEELRKLLTELPNTGGVSPEMKEVFGLTTPKAGAKKYHGSAAQKRFDLTLTPKVRKAQRELKRAKLNVKKTKLQWDDTAQTAFKQMKAGNLPEARWRKSNIEFTWAPKDLGGKGRGYIDVIKDVAGDDDYFALQKQFFEKIKTLPSGTEWTLEADTAQKYRLYKRMFRGDPRITPGGDTKLLKTRGIDHFVLRIP